jgi:arginine decarboxylase-like protein
MTPVMPLCRFTENMSRRMPENALACDDPTVMVYIERRTMVLTLHMLEIKKFQSARTL